MPVYRLQGAIAPKVLMVSAVPLIVPPFPWMPVAVAVTISVAVALPGIAVVVRAPPLQPLPVLHRPPRVSAVPAVPPPLPLGVLGTNLARFVFGGLFSIVAIGCGITECRRGRRGLGLRLLFGGEILVHLFAGGASRVEVALEMLPHHRLSMQHVDA